MEKPTIVKLEQSPGIRVATFEEAFGEWSEARGKRQEKKAARQQAKQTRKAAKQGAKQAKKQQRIESRLTRKATRKVGRQDVKAQKQAAKQDRKTAKALMKQDRRTAKAAARIDRRAMRRPDELIEEELQDENSLAMSDSAPVIDERGDLQEQPNTAEGTSESDESYDEPAYHDTNEDESAEENDEEYLEEEEGYDDESDEESEFNGGTAFEYDSADGGTQFSKEAIDGTESNVSEILRRIEANKFLIGKINQSLANLRAGMNQKLSEAQRADIISKMNRFKESLDKRNNRAVELTAQLEAFSQASGRRQAKQAARQSAKVERKAVKQAAKTAKVAAKVERQAVKQAGKTAKVAAKQERKAIKRPPVQEPGITEVEQGLNAEIEENRIEVPADEMSSANGIELYAMGDKNEEFVPEDRIVEVKYGADGISSGLRKVGISPNVILIGGALLLAYWANKKYNFVKV